MIDSLRGAYAQMPLGGSVLDIGCLGWRQRSMALECGRTDVRHYGTDTASTHAPPECIFRQADLDTQAVPYGDDQFDLVVASHVLEHLRRPVTAVADFLRVCRPGGVLYVEAPSERSLLLPGMPFGHEQFHSLSFFDDPTHVSRPWTPQSLHRLARYYGCVPERVGYRTSRRARILFPWYLARALVTRDARLLEWCLWHAIGWASYAVIRKPPLLTGRPTLTYFIPERR